MITRLTLCVGTLIFAAGTAHGQAYDCPGFGDVDVRITLIEGTDAAVAEFIAGVDNPSGGADPVTMRAQRGSAGIAYAGGDLVLSGSGDVAELTAGDVTVSCTLETTQADPEQVEEPADIVEEPEIEEAPEAPEVVETAEVAPDAGDGVNIPAISLGGNLRAGPGTDFADVGGLDEGADIVLLADTGEVFNGFNWWQIALPTGETAFQWGGVICVPGGGVSGVTDDPALCPALESEPVEESTEAVVGSGIAAISLGGNLRSGPGTAFPDIGGLERGTEITLLTDSGIPFDGYNWWEIELPNGDVAFQWGGVICVPAGGVAGVLASCQ